MSFVGNRKVLLGSGVWIDLLRMGLRESTVRL